MKDDSFRTRLRLADHRLDVMGIGTAGEIDDVEIGFVQSVIARDHVDRARDLSARIRRPNSGSVRMARLTAEPEPGRDPRLRRIIFPAVENVPRLITVLFLRNTADTGDNDVQLSNSVFFVDPDQARMRRNKIFPTPEMFRQRSRGRWRDTSFRGHVERKL